MKFSVLITVLLLFPTLSWAADYTCKDFASDLDKRYKQLEKDPDKKAEGFSGAYYDNYWFFLGAYYGHTGRQYNNPDNSELSKFEIDILQFCTDNPDIEVPVAALTILRNSDLKKQDPSVAEGNTNPTEKSPEETALIVAYIDWGTANCGQFPHPFAMMYVQSIRNGLDPKILEDARSKMNLAQKKSGIPKEELCEEFNNKMNDKPF